MLPQAVHKRLSGGILLLSILLTHKRGKVDYVGGEEGLSPSPTAINPLCVLHPLAAISHHTEPATPCCVSSPVQHFKIPLPQVPLAAFFGLAFQWRQPPVPFPSLHQDPKKSRPL